MSEQVTFVVQRRTVLGKAVRKLRRDGIIPGNIVEHGKESVPIQLNGPEFQRFLAKNAATTVLRLNVEGGTSGNTVMVQRVEHEPVTRAVLHVDFRHVNMRQPVHARVQIHLDGDAPGVKLYGAMVLSLLDHVEVEALPAELPQALDLDISSLTEPNSTLAVRDISVPKGVKVLTDPDEFVVKLEPPRMAEEAPTTAPEAAAPTPAEESEGEGSQE